MHTLTIWFTPQGADFFGLESTKSYGGILAPEASIADALKLILGDNVRYLEIKDLAELSEKDRTRIGFELRARIPVCDAPNPECAHLTVEVARVTALGHLSDPTSIPIKNKELIGDNPVDIGCGVVSKIPPNA